MRLAKELASLALIISIDVLWPGNSAINTWEQSNYGLIDAPILISSSEPDHRISGVARGLSRDRVGRG